MFFTINKIEQVVHPTNGLSNPKNPGSPMALAIYRSEMRMALFTAYSKKAYGEYWDEAERKKILSSQWTADMKTFAAQKVAGAPKPPYIFKLTIVGWIFMLLVVAFFGFMTYDSVKPPVSKPAEYVALEQAPVAGDIYFGRFEAFKNTGDRIASGTGFGWFKVIKVESDVYHIAKSTGISNKHKPKEELNSTDFEPEGTPAKITEQAGYMINLKAVDGKMEIYFTDKK